MTTPNTRETRTSQNVCTPRYNRDRAIRNTAEPQMIRTTRPRPKTATQPYDVTAFAVCPLGKLYPVAPGNADSTAVNEGSLTHGRGTRKIFLSKILEPSEKKPVYSTSLPNFLSPHQSRTIASTSTAASEPKNVNRENRKSSTGFLISSRT